jgi:endogenous inhibitor of DNA gyrase (YacG/DUF329 family)
LDVQTDVLQPVTKSRFVACPHCGATVEWTPAARWRPFCSERCKMIDLGAWASETYRVPVAENPDPDEPGSAPGERPPVT